MEDEFVEIGHSGGQLTIHVLTEEGQRKYQLEWSHNRPTPAVITAVYAIPQGVAVGLLKLGGIGQPWNAPPLPGCYPVFIGSDSNGYYGYQCPSCDGYWRSEAGSTVCPYCGTDSPRHLLLTPAQKAYVAQVCQFFNESLQKEDGEYLIDMDAVADAVGSRTPKPDFYYAEETQQKRFNCRACDTFNDILGKVGYCSACSTRNDLTVLQTETLPKIRAATNSDSDHGRRVVEAVGAFDIFARQYAKQLVNRVPMRPRRKEKLAGKSFHSLDTAAEDFRAAGDIDLLSGINSSDIPFVRRMFHRRHVYEHHGGVVDEKYITDSGDETVRLNQEIRETQPDVHRLIGLIDRMARNLHEGFHEIFPPNKQRIDDKWPGRASRGSGGRS